MSKIDVLDQAGNVVGDVELSEEIFDIEPNEHVVHQAVVQYLANQRQGTHSAKTRGEVRGGGRKPWKQKGSGRARAGSNRSPLWTGGGVIFAKKPRDYSQKMNRKAKNLAMRSVFSDKNQNNELRVIEAIEFEKPKTKDMLSFLEKIGTPDRALIVTKEVNPNAIRSSNNIPKVHTTVVNNLNVYDMLYYDNLILTKEALEAIEEMFAPK